MSYIKRYYYKEIRERIDRHERSIARLKRPVRNQKKVDRANAASLQKELRHERSRRM